MLKEKIHLKGFCFKKQEKAYGKLYGGEADDIYGDSFRPDGNVIRGIGNNVTIVYENMDFGQEGVSAVTICGTTPLKINTIHLLFTDKNGNKENRILEFQGTGSTECSAQRFSIDKISGSGKIELVFLPGCNFDLESLQFS